MVLNLRKRAEYLEAEGTMIEKNKTDFDHTHQNQSYFFKRTIVPVSFFYMKKRMR
ncbi:hypothetical protein EVI01_20840 [Enterococcus villorum]|uniref:Uncharacterized protein n=1 Tax=Enterococcus villorum TaxID=112904 RepID=A0A511J407_9ENTE|nr:hypothetical protein EVI01_20840 [Enterococcus villorum]